MPSFEAGHAGGEARGSIEGVFQNTQRLSTGEDLRDRVGAVGDALLNVVQA
jgi:hypothetical protein